jgi:two-component sensor histidine kinase
MGEVLRSGDSVQDREIVVEHVDGSRALVLVNINAFKDASGNILGAVNCFQDITQRTQSERRISTLAGEVEHRAKNILSTVKATVHLSNSDTPDGLKATIQGRIDALAQVHVLFARSGWAGAELSAIAEQELAPYLQEDELRARIDGPHLLLAPSTAQGVAVIFHELSTNAAKYGSLSVPEGQVEVTWSRAADGRLIINWVESGGPAVNKPTSEGFGTSVIDRMIGGLGEIHREWRAEGLSCQVTLQL